MANGDGEAPLEPQYYLCHFLHRYLDFRLPEAESLTALDAECSTSGDTQALWQPPCGGPGAGHSPFWYIKLPSEAAARRLCIRALLIKSICEVWGEGATLDELHTALQALPRSKVDKYAGKGVTWKIEVDCWGRRFRTAEQVALIEGLSFLDFQGEISLESPDQTFRLVGAQSQELTGLPGQVPTRWYFGREVARCKSRHVLSRYALPQRCYLGPTSMDTEMAFLMCNQAQVRPGCLVYDLFTGTGSILVAAAHLGARTIGSDIDIKVIRDGREDDAGRVRNVWSNFREYNLRAPVGLVRCDAHKPPFRHGLEDVFDAIITDPPYGVRAGGRKARVAPQNGHSANAAHWPAEADGQCPAEQKIPATDPYTFGECLRDLLDSSARLLRLGGRLVFFVPALPEIFTEEEVPRHPALELVANSEQILTSRYSRRLITMAKVRPYDAAESARHKEEMAALVHPCDRLHKLVFAANGNGGYAGGRKYRNKLV